MTGLAIAGLILILIVILGVLLMFGVHVAIEYSCLVRARRYCRKNGLEIRRFRIGPEIDSTGMKTEFTVVELDCLDRTQQPTTVRLIAWLFGVRSVERAAQPESN